VRSAFFFRAAPSRSRRALSWAEGGAWAWRAELARPGRPPRTRALSPSPRLARDGARTRGARAHLCSLSTHTRTCADTFSAEVASLATASRESSSLRLVPLRSAESPLMVWFDGVGWGVWGVLCCVRGALVCKQRSDTAAEQRGDARSSTCSHSPLSTAAFSSVVRRAVSLVARAWQARPRGTGTHTSTTLHTRAHSSNPWPPPPPWPPWPTRTGHPLTSTFFCGCSRRKMASLLEMGRGPRMHVCTVHCTEEASGRGRTRARALCRERRTHAVPHPPLPLPPSLPFPSPALTHPPSTPCSSATRRPSCRTCTRPPSGRRASGTTPCRG
jgi:hypothetical protein